MNDAARRSPVGLSRRTALAGLGAGGLGLALAATARPAAAQYATPAALAEHPIVGLWQDNNSTDETPDIGFEIFHADGTYVTWGGPATGVSLGIWRATGETSGEIVFISQDTDPTSETEEPGTTTFRATLTVDPSGSRLSYTNGTIDVRDAFGGSLFADAVDLPSSTRVTFAVNPATGSTVAATPTAGTSAA